MTSAQRYHELLAEEREKLVYFLERLELLPHQERSCRELAMELKALPLRGFTYESPLVSKLEAFFETLEESSIMQMANRGATVNALQEVLYRVWELTDEAQDDFLVEELLQNNSTSDVASS